MMNRRSVVRRLAALATVLPFVSASKVAAADPLIHQDSYWLGWDHGHAARRSDDDKVWSEQVSASFEAMGAICEQRGCRLYIDAVPWSQWAKHVAVDGTEVRLDIHRDERRMKMPTPDDMWSRRLPMQATEIRAWQRALHASGA